MGFLSTYFQIRIAWREAYPDINSLLSTSLFFFVVSACFLFACYSIDVYDFLVSKKRVCIVLVGPWISRSWFPMRHVGFGHFWPFMFALEIRYSDPGFHVF